MRVGYGKLGRSMPLTQEQWGLVGGDDEPPLLLHDLARRNPDVEFVIVGRNSGENPQEIGFPANVTNPWTELRPIVAQACSDLPFDVTGKTKLPLDQRFELMTMYDRLTMPMFGDLDHMILWLGQHGTSNSPIPLIQKRKLDTGDTYTTPYISFAHYSSYILRGINYWRRLDPLKNEEIVIIADARNYAKARDAKWPYRHPILGQFEMHQPTKHERYGDTRQPEECGFEAEWETDHVWVADSTYAYSRLEICGILPQHIDHRFSDDYNRQHFGLFINEARKDVTLNRLDALRDYVLPLQPAFIHGTWTRTSLKELAPLVIEPAPWSEYYDKIRSVRCTFTTPSSGSGWATTKPWQAFAVGTVCFFHPAYDTQDNILGDAPADLKAWLRVTSTQELHDRVTYLNDPANESVWRALIHMQRAHYDKAVQESRHLKMIEERLV